MHSCQEVLFWIRTEQTTSPRLRPSWRSSEDLFIYSIYRLTWQIKINRQMKTKTYDLYLYLVNIGSLLWESLSDLQNMIIHINQDVPYHQLARFCQKVWSLPPLIRVKNWHKKITLLEEGDFWLNFCEWGLIIHKLCLWGRDKRQTNQKLFLEANFMRKLTNECVHCTIVQSQKEEYCHY